MDDVAREPAPFLSGDGEAMLFAIAGLCVALDVGLGTLVNLIKLPVYLDAVGTIAFALLAGRMGFRGFVMAALVGTAGFVITGLLVNPAVLWFIPTQIAIAAYSFYVARPLLKAYFNGGSLKATRIGLIVLLGIGLGIVAGAVSAPIIAFVFGGITGAGASLIVAALLKAGSTLFQSVLASGIASEPIDKTLQLFAAIALVRATPSRARRLFF
jgi:energy-coupling factor transport system substrate-specific component